MTAGIVLLITRLDPPSDTIRNALARHYQKEGVPDDAWHIGPEHPALERAALEVLETLVGRHVVEIGFQAGGFAVPIIFALHRDPRFRYVGVDNLAYTNSVRPATIEEFLQRELRRDVTILSKAIDQVLNDALTRLG